jgi:23S rRNA (pseudouridine1915-N3)-methyltransferase
MHVRVLCIGKIKQSFVLDGEAEYRKRLRPYLQYEVVELTPAPSTLGVNQVRAKETQEAFTRVKSHEWLIVLDEQGTELTSTELASVLQTQMTQGRSAFVFAIGGAHGWDSALKERANLVLSLSRFTFPYQLVRLILAEQIYRAVTLNNGIPYHKQ